MSITKLQMMRWALDRSPLPVFVLSYKTNTLSKRRIIHHRGFPRFCSIVLPMEMKANKFGHLSFSEQMMSLKRAHQMWMTSAQSYVSVKLQDDISDIGVTLWVSEPSSLYQWHWCNLTCKWNFKWHWCNYTCQCTFKVIPMVLWQPYVSENPKVTSIALE